MRHSLSRVLIIFGTVVCLVVWLGCLTAHLYLKDYTREQKILMLDASARNDAEKLDRQLSDLMQRLHRVSEHDVTKHFVIENAVGRFSMLEHMQIMLEDASVGMPMVEDMRLYMGNGVMMHTGGARTSFSVHVENVWNELVDPVSFRPSRSGITRVATSGQFAGIVLYRPIIQATKVQAVLTCLVDLNILLQELADSEGVHWLSYEDVLIGAPEVISQQGYATETPLQNGDLVLHTLYPGSAVLESPDAIHWPFMIGLVSLILIGCTLFFVHKQIVTPIRAITDQMQTLKNVYASSAVDENENEIVTLTDGLNEMIERVDETTREILQLQESVLQAENKHLQEKILFLQAQINPHFLYNNLECIRGMIAAGNGQNARSITLYMASIYRYCLGKADNVTLEQELECLKDYMSIMALRYDGAYRLETDVPESLFDHPAVRMMLQPLAENAIQHGFLESNRQAGCILVSARNEEDGLRVFLCDNGGGIDTEAMLRLNQSLRDQPGNVLRRTEHIGLHNVNARIRLLYGEESGIFISAAPNGGTVCEIRIIW